MSTMFKACENCKKNKGASQFRHDCVSGDYICTFCGCVVSKYIYNDRELTFTDAKSTPRIHKANMQSESRESVQNEQRLLRFFPEIRKEKVVQKTTDELAFKLDCNDRCKSRAMAQINKFQKILELPNLKMVLIANLIVSKRSLGYYVNIKYVSKYLNVGDLGKHVMKICKIIGISQLNDPTKNTAYYLSALGFSYKFVARFNKLYTKARTDNGSIGCDTLMALCLIRFFVANETKSSYQSRVDLPYIANLTRVSEISLKSYIDSDKSTLFTDKNRMSFKEKFKHLS